MNLMTLTRTTPALTGSAAHEREVPVSDPESVSGLAKFGGLLRQHGRVLRHGRYEIDDNPARIDQAAAWRFLSSEAYWNRWRSESEVQAQIDGAWRVVGAYDQRGEMVGFARAIADGVAIAYLANVYVLTEHRRRGLGVALVRAMIEHGSGASFRWMLHTADAHDLYRRFGFAEAIPTYMERHSAAAGGNPHAV